MKPVLLLVDLQNDFLRVGDLEPHPASIVAAAADLLNVCRTSAVPVVHVWSTVNRSGYNRMPLRWKNDDWMCLEDSAGHACPDSLRPHKKEPIMHKTFVSAFSTRELDLVSHDLRVDALMSAGAGAALAARRESLQAWWRIGVGEGLGPMRAFGWVLQNHAAELIDLLLDDIARPISYGRDEVARAIALIAAAAAQVEPGQHG